MPGQAPQLKDIGCMKTILKRKNIQNATLQSQQMEGGKAEREGKKESLTEDNRHPDKNSQHTRINTLLNVFSRQDARKQHARLPSLSLSLQQTMQSHLRARLIVAPPLSLPRLSTLHKNFGLLCVELAQKLDTYVPSPTHHHVLGKKVQRREQSWTFSGGPSVGRHALLHTHTRGLSDTPMPAVSCSRNETPRLAGYGQSERPAITQRRCSEHIKSSQRHPCAVIPATASPPH